MDSEIGLPGKSSAKIRSPVLIGAPKMAVGNYTPAKMVIKPSLLHHAKGHDLEILPCRSVSPD
jgi:hypothetical protein